jgi:hypothetical protein
LYVLSCSSSELETVLVTNVRLGFYVTGKGKPHALFPVVLGGLIVILAGSAFFLSFCERLPG